MTSMAIDTGIHGVNNTEHVYSSESRGMPEDNVHAIGESVVSHIPGRKRRGPKPGQRHSGQFKKGDDPRRWTDGPRIPKVKRQFQEQVREMTDQALEVLAECLEDGNAPWRERRSAAELVLAHGHGAPVSRVLMAQVGSEGSGGASQLSLEQLRSKAQSLLDEDVIDEQ
jgi:hypothetical protein